MSGKQSRIRRIQAIELAKGAVYSTNGILSSPPIIFNNQRQQSIFECYFIKFRAKYWEHENRLQDLFQVYGNK